MSRLYKIRDFIIILTLYIFAKHIARNKFDFKKDWKNIWREKGIKMIANRQGCLKLHLQTQIREREREMHLIEEEYDPDALLSNVAAGRRGFISHLSLPLQVTIFNPFHPRLPSTSHIPSHQHKTA